MRAYALSMIVVLALTSGPAWAGQVVERVLARGKVVCGIDQTPGFGGFDERGIPIGFETDLCRAIATAVLKNPNAIQVQRVTSKYKFHALAEGELDVAFGMTTWTFDRDTGAGASFPVTTFYDGQGFMKWTDVADPWAAGATICVQTATTSAANLGEYLARRKSPARVLALSSSEEKFNAFAERRCGMVTGDNTELVVNKARRTAMAGSWTMLDILISREPLGPAVAAGDVEWFSIVRWALLVPIIAEARGVGRDTIAQANALDTEMRRLMGDDPGFGSGIRLDPAWARRIVQQVGNYGEIFNRNLAPLGIDRGLNRLWTEGGLLYAPPLR